MDYNKKSLILVVQSCGHFVSSNILPEVNEISEQTSAARKNKTKQNNLQDTSYKGNKN